MYLNIDPFLLLKTLELAHQALFGTGSHLEGWARDMVWAVVSVTELMRWRVEGETGWRRRSRHNTNSTEQYVSLG